MAKKEDGYPHNLPDWQRESLQGGYEQDALAGQRRLDELEATGNGDTPAAEQAREQIENAKRELKRLGTGQESASKRPAAGAKEKRA